MRLIKDTIPRKIIQQYHKSEERAFERLETYVSRVFPAKFDDNFEKRLAEEQVIKFENPRLVAGLRK